jgi:DNA repair exonuclease SbcCD nuclease subunit
MSKIALISDIHLGCRNDSQTMINAHKKFFTTCFFPTLENHGIKDVFILGDLFDRRKFGNFNTLYHTKEFLFDYLNENFNTHILIGNHDTFYRNTNRVNSPKLLLQEYTNIKVYDHPVITSGITLIPWTNEENHDECMQYIKKGETDLLFGHFDIVGFEMHSGGGKCFEGFDPKTFSKYEHVYTGHFHQPNTIENITYLGSPLQFTWADYGCKRGFSILDTETNDLTFVENPDRMFHKIFYDEDLDILEFDYDSLSDKVVRVLVGEKEDQHKFDLFIDKIQMMNPFQLDVVDNTHELQIQNIDRETIEQEDTMSMIG